MKASKELRIVVFGAAGSIGSRIVAQALMRGHQVTAVVRNVQQLPNLPEAAISSLADAADTNAVVQLGEGKDVIISAIRPPDGQEEILVPTTKSLLAGASQAGVRIIVVGGAASLEMPGERKTTVLTEPGFLPQEIVPIARACAAQYEACMADTAADWSYLSPPAMLSPGRRTNAFRLGGNTLLIDGEGSSAISIEDFAVAILDEAESPRHRRQRFTVAY